MSVVSQLNEVKHLKSDVDSVKEIVSQLYMLYLKQALPDINKLSNIDNETNTDNQSATNNTSQSSS